MTDEFDDEWDTFEKEVTVIQKNNVECPTLTEECRSREN